MRLLLFSIAGASTELYETVYADLAAAYREAAARSATYRQWLLRHDSPLLGTATPTSVPAA